MTAADRPYDTQRRRACKSETGILPATVFDDEFLRSSPSIGSILDLSHFALALDSVDALARNSVDSAMQDGVIARP